MKESMGQIISNLRKEKGMTQKELAEILGITDKAVSKWERDLAYPDTALIPQIAELFGISTDDLLSAKSVPCQQTGKKDDIVGLILSAIPLAMGLHLLFFRYSGKQTYIRVLAWQASVLPASRSTN